jgi:2,4-dienoyl-CoA reductase-like NADH-dependent reductase (Old Yellow Enzyme family)
MYEKEPLFQPIKIGNRTAFNRFVINAMEGCDADKDGNPSDLTLARYEQYFKNGCSVVDLEAITVTDVNRGRLNQLQVQPRNAKALTQFVKRLKEINKDVIFIWQLTHSGELSHPDFSRRVCVKPLPGFGGDLLSEEEVQDIEDKFVLAAKICHDAGADGVDFKNCHGYLGSQLVRPYNDRDWKYGGSFANRTRFTFNIYERMVKDINDPNFIYGSKVSIWEGFPGGQGSAGPDSPVMDLSESMALIKGMEDRGANYIMQSAGSPSITLALSQPDKAIPVDIYHHFSFQKACKDVLKPETVVIGSAYSVLNKGNNNLQARKKEENTLFYWGNKNIKDGVTDMIAIGRQSFADSALPNKFKEGKEDEIKWCTACDNCIEFLIRQQPVACATYNKEWAKRLVAIRKEEGALKEKRT